MNGLLRHTCNIHLGMWNRLSKLNYLGIVFNNVKAGYTFVANGFSSTKTGVIGLISNTKL